MTLLAVEDDLDEELDYQEMVDVLVKRCLDDFPEEEASAVAKKAAEVAQKNITQGTRKGHERYVQGLFRSQAV